ncbi:hypothetical protein N7533_001276 [Penicillium manginii]|uniref:uncharacterized protein n=1 Tax=Penicillium manginii TaxID=203109 RepID=UPI0025478097|nr:uncharacterized protein N7533_001276 [Penicillium manginii]KAJ5768693.1 hypothetical protein N7533_001276 [Penicillium manginii]
MRSSTFATSLLVAFLPISVIADWAQLQDVVKTEGCGDGCSSLAPIFEDDAFDGIFDKLVEDGYASAGSAAFAKSDDFSCDDAKFAGQLTCTNAFRAAFASMSGFCAYGGTRSSQQYVHNADGTQLGAIVLTESCIPALQGASC